MNYKEFGIYVNDDTISVLVQVNKSKIVGIDYNLKYYFESNSGISNKEINDWLYKHYSIIEPEQIFEIESNSPIFENIFDDYGYIGEVNDNKLKTEIENFIGIMFSPWY